MTAFRKQRDLAFVDHLIAHLRQHHAAAVDGDSSDIPEERLRQRVVDGIRRARSYGLTWESAIGGFVALQFVIAPRFDEQFAIHQVLTDSSTPPDERMGLLNDSISAADWFDASTSAAFSHWPEQA